MITLEQIEEKLRVAYLQFRRTGSDADAEVVVTLERARERMRVSEAKAWADKALEASDADELEPAKPIARLRAGR